MCLFLMTSWALDPTDSPLALFTWVSHQHFNSTRPTPLSSSHLLSLISWVREEHPSAPSPPGLRACSLGASSHGSMSNPCWSAALSSPPWPGYCIIITSYQTLRKLLDMSLCAAENNFAKGKGTWNNLVTMNIPPWLLFWVLVIMVCHEVVFKKFIYIFNNLYPLIPILGVSFCLFKQLEPSIARLGCN